MKYVLEYDKRVKKDLKNIEKSRLLYLKSELENLAVNPDKNPHIIKLQGNNPYYRLRLKYDYRVIFTKNDTTLIILIIKIGHRREIYKQL